MGRGSGGGGGIAIFPKPPKGVSDIVREAYRQGVSPNRFGMTDADRRVLARGVRNGDLSYGRDVYGWRHWYPIVTIRKTGIRIPLGVQS